MQPDPEAKPVEYLLERAWDIKFKITKNIKGTKLSDGLRKIWEQTIEDRDEGSSIGPFWSEAEVTEKLGTDQWVPTQRFEVHQKNKVRGCDSATVNLVNVVTVVLEKLQLPSTDENVAVIRMLLPILQELRSELGSWTNAKHTGRSQSTPRTESSQWWRSGTSRPAKSSISL